MDEEQENGKLLQHPIATLHYPPNISLQPIRSPTLNKIATYPQTNSLYCAYSDGKLIHYDTRNYQLSNIFSIYDNTDIIDLQLMGSNLLVTCTHNEVTLFDIVKDKSLSLKGHEETPISVAAHPFSPLVTSISNLVLQHDLRVRKPINVNFITPPVYGVQYFSDGTYYFLSGQPCRVGRDTWVKTLLNGIGKPSENCKYVAVNDMSGSIIFWDWKRSKIIASISDVQNEDSYQPVYFAKKDGDIRGLVFLQDNGNLLEYDLLSKETVQKRQIIQRCSQENWKFHVDDSYTTDKVYVYEHDKAVVKCFRSHQY